MTRLAAFAVLGLNLLAFALPVRSQRGRNLSITVVTAIDDDASG